MEGFFNRMMTLYDSDLSSAQVLQLSYVNVEPSHMTFFTDCKVGNGRRKMDRALGSASGENVRLCSYTNNETCYVGVTRWGEFRDVPCLGGALSQRQPQLRCALGRADACDIDTQVSVRYRGSERTQNHLQSSA